jgi:RNA polymerase sigma-70 factor (ECF subfamily)
MDLDDQEKGSQLLQLFARHNRALRAYSRLILPSVDPIDDVMQEASVVIWEKQDQLRHEDEFLPWAKTIVRNISFRHRRKLFRDRHVFDDGLVERILAEEEAEQDGGDQASREYGALMSCLNKLPEERKQLILAPYRDPGAVKELAEQGSRSPNSLYKLLQRLGVNLLKCLEAELNSAPVVSLTPNDSTN